mmetsp:Transcript_14513/g.35144  ORF Transcript_14513/g.35144 Transcript_14513/m.35144 type:complete len:139 (+) Transcript_14513:61-477(+)
MALQRAIQRNAGLRRATPLRRWNEWFPYEPTPESPQLQPYAVQLTQNQKQMWCACGKSKTQPWCDGSHKGTHFKPVAYFPRWDGVHLMCGCKYSGKFRPRCDGTHYLVMMDKHTYAAGGTLFGLCFVLGFVSTFALHP